jgi:hypothetical protein
VRHQLQKQVKSKDQRQKTTRLLSVQPFVKQDNSTPITSRKDKATNARRVKLK